MGIESRRGRFLRLSCDVNHIALRIHFITLHVWQMKPNKGLREGTHILALAGVLLVISSGAILIPQATHSAPRTIPSTRQDPPKKATLRLRSPSLRLLPPCSSVKSRKAGTVLRFAGCSRRGRCGISKPRPPLTNVDTVRRRCRLGCWPVFVGNPPRVPSRTVWHLGRIEQPGDRPGIVLSGRICRIRRAAPGTFTRHRQFLVAPETRPLSAEAVPIAGRFATLQFRWAKSATLIDLARRPRLTSVRASRVRFAAASGRRADR
jgi:hypothetical protein